MKLPGIFLSATWEYLAMLNYEVDPAILQKHLPPYTEIDYFNGKALVSMVGFLFNNTRVMGVKWPGHINFEEVNLRYYIRHYDGKQWRRGVAFISEIVPKQIIARMANLFYNEHYSTAVMTHQVQIENDLIHAAYQWKQGADNWNELSITGSSELQNIEPGSEAEFIFEHYYGYNKLSSTATIEYSLAHPRWQVYPVTNASLSCDVEKLYGADFLPFLQGVAPRSAFLAKGSSVQVKFPRYIRRQHGEVTATLIK